MVNVLNIVMRRLLGRVNSLKFLCWRIAESNQAKADSLAFTSVLKCSYLRDHYFKFSKSVEFLTENKLLHQFSYRQFEIEMKSF